MHSEAPVYVWADEFKAEQVLNNYLSNAIHYCKNENRIEVTVTRRDDIVRIGVFNSGGTAKPEVGSCGGPPPRILLFQLPDAPTSKGALELGTLI